MDVQGNRDRNELERSSKILSDSYVQRVVRGVLKALEVLATLSFDLGLMYWVKGLRNYLEEKMKETD